MVTPTAEQQAIVEFVKNSTENVEVKALAGSGKTSALVLVAEALPKVKILSLAFNKAIATEMQERLPENCTAMTLNALGHRSWGTSIGKSITLDTSKNFRLLKEATADLKGDEKNSFYGEGFSETLQTITAAKRQGFQPGIFSSGTKSLMKEADFFDSTDVILSGVQKRIVKSVLRSSWNEAVRGNIDFNDQILCPTLYDQASFPMFDVVLVDEAQDLSFLDHTMIAKVVRNGRLIVVGDPYQAIYAFRGAEEHSMALMAKQFKMVEFGLTISFRCAQDIIRNVHWRAPEMTWLDNAPLGEVVAYKSWNADEIPDGSAIVCRQNAPLFECALNLLESGRKPQLGSRDIIAQLKKILNGLGNGSMKKEDVIDAIDLWKTKQLQKRRDQGHINDIANCLLVLSARCETLNETISLAETIESQPNGIYLSTIHKAKGLEFESVFILDAHLIRFGHSQENNIAYVAGTRAKTFLGYITTRGYSPSADATVMPRLVDLT